MYLRRALLACSVGCLLFWSPVQDATGYQIERRNVDGDWAVCATTGESQFDVRETESDCYSHEPGPCEIRGPVTG